MSRFRRSLMNRKGEKTGWLGGWFGCFIWLFILSVVWLFQGKYLFSVTGLLCFGTAIFCIFHFRPWNYPETKYWKLMLPIYILFIASAIMTLYFFGATEHPGMGWYSYFWIIPCLTPLMTIGSRTWNAFSGKSDNNNNDV